ncbi:DUF3265 domain-containing protein [Vibrio vulnificus]|nr:DUF3265 domain-containing protein [Vibrio vulnificus]
MTRRLSGIHAAWHFWFTVSFGGESCLRKVGLCGIHPLTQRYVIGVNRDIARISYQLNSILISYD